MFSHTYNEHLPTDLADKVQMGSTLAIGRLIASTSLNTMAKGEPERFEALTRAGFLTECYGDLFWTLFERGGGHYIDIGTSKKIAEGKVSIKD
jgi:hypothetical protein